MPSKFNSHFFPLGTSNAASHMTTADTGSHFVLPSLVYSGSSESDSISYCMLQEHI